MLSRVEHEESLKPLARNVHVPVITIHLNEPRCEKTGLRGFRQGPTQTGLYSDRRWLEARNFGFRKKRDCTICVPKTKALISICKKPDFSRHGSNCVIS